MSNPHFPYKGSVSHALAQAAAGQTLPLWQQSESSPAGNPYTYTMVGTSPFVAGAGTTTITAPIIPIKFVDAATNTVLSDASQVASDCGQTHSPVGLTQISPMFQSVVPDPGGNQTQWVDALQRGNFNQQTKVGGISPNYHLLLQATTPGGITIIVPSGDSTQQLGAFCGTLTGIAISWFFSNFPTIVANLESQGFISTTQFPLFVMYNSFLCDVSACNGGALGFHDVVQTASGLQIFGIYDYDLTGSFPSTDTGTMSHELAEAIDDPLTINPVPTWGYIGQDPATCQQNLEPGDPLSAGFPGSPGLVSDSYTVNGISYVFSLQDMAYHSWFYREASPPTSMDIAAVLGSGAYSVFGFFTGGSDSTVCPGQPTGVTATAGNGQAQVSWTAGPGPVDSYIVIPYLGTTPQTPQIFSSTATSHTINGLTKGSAYTFTVIAAHANANSGDCPYNQLQLSAESGFDCSTESIPSNSVTPGGAVPTLSQMSPNQGPASGNVQVALTGSNFSTTPGATTVKFGSTAATSMNCSSTTSCTAVEPAGTAGPASVTVTVGGQTSTAVTFTYYNPGLLRVTTTPALASQISVDGVITDTWGLTWVKEPPGSHMVCFSDVQGYTTPACQTVTVTAGNTTTVNGAFVQRGFLHVITSPAVPGEITYMLSGTTTAIPMDDWGGWTDLGTGTYTVCFGAVAGFTPPACQSGVSVTAGNTTTITGTYTAKAGAPGQTGVGLLRVTTSPALPSQITVDGNISDTFGLNWLEMAPGSHMVCFSSVQGYTKPGCQTVTVTAGNTTTVTGTFTQRGFLQVHTSPAVAGTIYTNGIPGDDWGLFTDLPVGTYTVCFGAVSGQASPACQTPTVTAGTTTTITGTY